VGGGLVVGQGRFGDGASWGARYRDRYARIGASSGQGSGAGGAANGAANAGAGGDRGIGGRGWDRISALTAPGPPPDSTGAELLGLEPGDTVRHPRYGAGVVTHVEGEGLEARAEVRFLEGRTRRFILHATPLGRL
jgi:DNA helicase II / ATP-dependent DNA helicase PcrA